MPRTEGVQAVARAIDILRSLGDSPGPLTLAQIADESGLARSTVHRIVQTLIESNFIVADRENGGLRLGPELARLAAVSGVKLMTMARPYLVALSQSVDEGASLAVLEGSRVRFLDQAIAGPGVRAFSVVGSTMPAHSTANGKAILAALPDRTVRTILPNKLPAYTPGTIVDRQALFTELQSIRSNGVAFDLEENEPGICAVGASVRDAAGNLAAVTVAATSARFHSHKEALTIAVARSAAEITAALSLPPS